MNENKEFDCYVYVDESGQHDLDTEKAGASNLFVCVAVVFEPRCVEIGKGILRNISNKKFNGAEIKSSKIHHRRRVEILREIASIPFGFYALIIDKARVYKDSGLKYKDSFYKYLYNMLYHRVNSPGKSTLITADEICGRNFQTGFEKYLYDKREYLFSPFKFRFCSSKNEPLIQLADLIAGTLNQCFDKSKWSEHNSEYWRMLETKKIEYFTWPQPKDYDNNWCSQQRSGIDADISRFNMARVQEFIMRFEDDSDTTRRMQVAILNHLLLKSTYEYNYHSRCATASDLIEYLNEQDYREISDQFFRTKIIAPLRDERIIITGTDKGYTIALSMSDIDDYLRHTNNVILPMLTRLNAAREVVSLDSVNSIDILESDKYSNLKSILEAFNNSKVTRFVEEQSTISDIDDENQFTC